MFFCVCVVVSIKETKYLFLKKKKVLNVNKSVVRLLMITASHYCSVLSIKSLVNKHLLGTGSRWEVFVFWLQIIFSGIASISLHTSATNCSGTRRKYVLEHMCSLHIHPFYTFPQLNTPWARMLLFAALHKRSKMLKSDGTRVIPIIFHVLLQAVFHIVF